MLGVFIGDGFTEDRLAFVKMQLGSDCVVGSYKIDSTGEYLYLLRLGEVQLFNLFRPEVFVRGNILCQGDSYEVHGTRGIQVWGVINTVYYNRGCYSSVVHALLAGRVSREDAVDIAELVGDFK